MKRDCSDEPDPNWGMEWLLEFGQKDLSQLQDKEQRDLLLETQFFFRFSANTDLDIPAPLPDFARKVASGRPAMRFTDLRRVHKLWQEGLDQLFGPEMAKNPPPKGQWRMPVVTLRIELARTITPLPPLSRFKSGHPSSLRARFESLAEKWTGRARVRGTIREVSVGGWQETFWQLVRHLLTRYGDRIQHCAECKKLYLKRKRQGYCTSQCSQRARSRKWYSNNRENAREIRRRTYARKMKNKYGENVQIRRRIQR